MLDMTEGFVGGGRGRKAACRFDVCVCAPVNVPLPRPRCTRRRRRRRRYDRHPHILRDIARCTLFISAINSAAANRFRVS